MRTTSATQRPKADEIPRRVVARVHVYPEGNDQGAHSHQRAQLAGADRATFTVTTPRATWVVPAGWAIWIPSMVDHTISSAEQLSLFSIYLDPEDTGDLPHHACIVTIPQLLEKMILHANTIPELYEVKGPDARFMQVLVDQIVELPPAPIAVVVPQTGNLRRIYDALSQDPLDPRGLEDWALELSVSRRTLTRLFVRAVGVSFKTWRTQLKLVRALERLGAGESVKAVSLDLGYSSGSAFAAVFKRYLGTAPTRYFS
ncbi:MAG: helix-turn-helix transcriptional regulator [Gemmatimonadetes bacterium]|jgi:AraC-like DNA-binding protein|nr:helix-turn-helix transcriptional regulator [Gemmatimonadota bacterium]